ncbi:hypothetical protein CEXT_526641, partial [Caerostris extrusa]
CLSLYFGKVYPVAQAWLRKARPSLPVSHWCLQHPLPPMALFAPAAVAVRDVEDLRPMSTQDLAAQLWMQCL